MLVSVSNIVFIIICIISVIILIILILPIIMMIIIEKHTCRPVTKKMVRLQVRQKQVPRGEPDAAFFPRYLKYLQMVNSFATFLLLMVSFI